MSALSSQDQQFGRTALQMGVVTSTQLQHALQVQHSWSAQGQRFPLSQVLMKLGFVNAKHIVEVQTQLDAGLFQNTASPAPAVPAPARPAPLPAVPAPLPAVPAPAPAVPAPAVPLFGDVPKPKLQILPGLRLGPYKILSKLGEGGVGTVFKAHQQNIDRTVAVKVLHPEVAANPVNLQRFRQEAVAAGKIQHPNLVGVIDYLQHQGLHAMVMPFIDGDSFEKQLKAGLRPRLPVVYKVLHRIGDVLREMDSAKLIHRDIKPGNILFRKDGEPCLMDLGLAKVADAEHTLTAEGNTVGTPEYMSPEQCLGRDLSIKSDVYALGASLFHLLTGRAPFSGQTSLELMKNHVRAPVPDPRTLRPDIEPELAALIMQMLGKDPSERPSPEDISARAVAHTGEDFDPLAVSGISPGTSDVAEAPKKSSKRRSTQAGAKSAKKKGRRRATTSSSKASKRKKTTVAGVPKSPALSSSGERKAGRSRGRVRRARSDSSTLIMVTLFGVVVAVLALLFLIMQSQSGT